MHNIAKGNIECSLVSATFPGKPFRSLPKASSIAQRIQEEQGIPLKEKRTSNSGMATSHARWLWGLIWGWLQRHWGYPAALSCGGWGASEQSERARALLWQLQRVKGQHTGWKLGTSSSSPFFSHEMVGGGTASDLHSRITWLFCSTASSWGPAVPAMLGGTATKTDNKINTTQNQHQSTIKENTSWKFLVHRKFKINAKLWYR